MKRTNSIILRSIPFTLITLMLLLCAQTGTATTRYVWTNSPSPTAPYTNWQTAAHVIQDAVDVAQTDDIVLVTNGVYDTGGGYAYGLTNRVCIENAIIVSSINGPSVTSIKGRGPIGINAIRGVYLGHAAALSGFTITDGNTKTNHFLVPPGPYTFGGGIIGEDLSAIASNCIITDNSAHFWGGGACNVSLYNCILMNNSSSREGGGAYECTMHYCTISKNSASESGGGVNRSTLESCVLSSNKANSGGGATSSDLRKCTITDNLASNGAGAIGSTLYNCILKYNSSSNGMGGGTHSCSLFNSIIIENSSSTGGGAHASSLSNCTIKDNTADSVGGGTADCTIKNCIIWSNTAPIGPDYYSSTINYSCAPNLTNGVNGNITNNPSFVSPHSDNLRLSSNSPCINTGTNMSWMTGETDLDGRPRIIDTTVDMGAYEYWSGHISATISPTQYLAAPNGILTATTTVDGVVTGYEIDWGDGHTSVNESISSHTYLAAGTYGITLSAWNESTTATATATATILDSVYVSPFGSHIPPFTSWANAATTIQDAVDSLPGDSYTIWVSNGVYQAGGRMAEDVFTRVVLDKSVTLQSINGESDTIIVGGEHEYGYGHRCVFLSQKANIKGFTLINGQADKGGAVYADNSWIGIAKKCTLTTNLAINGGAVYCESGATGYFKNCSLHANMASNSGGGAFNAVLHNCTITENSARWGGGICTGTLYNSTLSYNVAYIYGGGAYHANLINSLVTQNTATENGGGAYWASINNCTLTDNTAHYGGGTARSSLFNSIVYYNHAKYEENHHDSTLSYSCTTPQAGGTGNFTNAPNISSSSNPHLLDTSPCIDAGACMWARGASDIDNEPRTNGTSVDVGCDERWSPDLTGPLYATIHSSMGTNVATGYPIEFQAEITGKPSSIIWSFGDGVTSLNTCRPRHAFATAGVYEVTLRITNLTQEITATTSIHVVDSFKATWYVKPEGKDSLSGHTWSDAKATIQAAIDDASWLPGSTILVTNGIYNSNGKYAAGLTNRICVTNAIIVRSVNGAAHTAIEGQGPLSNTAVRCAYLAKGAILSGFTITNGYTSDITGESCNGGGIYAANKDVIISNCLLQGNSAIYGGGVRYGTLYNCTLSGNFAYSGGGAYNTILHECILSNNTSIYGGGGANYSTLYNCLITGNSVTNYGGGGISYSTLFECIVTDNSAYFGGGAHASIFYNSLLTDNSATSGGGGYMSTLYNCTLTGNSAHTEGGGAHAGTIYNCIVWGNTAPIQNDIYDADSYFTCSPDVPHDVDGNLTNNPKLVCLGTTNLRLLPSSPCINAGTNMTWMTGETDLDGQPRIIDTTVDMGAYEYWEGHMTGDISVTISPTQYLAAPNGILTATATVDGVVTGYEIDWGDGHTSVNESISSHAYLAAGVYGITLSAWNDGTSTTATATATILDNLYVSQSGSHTRPFATWADAATNIQDAIDALNGDEYTVWVTNGVYDIGSREVAYNYTRVVLDKSVDLRSVNGANTTFIKGNGYGYGYGYGYRCAFLTRGANMNGFTLLQGYAENGGGIYVDSAWIGSVDNCVLYDNKAVNGGGIYSESYASGYFYNCHLLNNMASDFGGGATRGTLIGCTVKENSAVTGGGGTYYSELQNCSLISNRADTGAGSLYGTLYNCTLKDNMASHRGGGAALGTLINCIITDNSSLNVGGGTYFTRTHNCTIINNIAANQGGGTYGVNTDNCIIWSNSAASYNDITESTANHCCSPDVEQGIDGNITNSPMFVDWDTTNLHLQAASPCIDSGTYLLNVPVDMDDIPRPLDGNNDGTAQWDMGVYEYVNPLADTDGDWLADTNEIAGNTSPILADSDGDAMLDGAEILAGTDPLDDDSFLGMFEGDPISGEGIVVEWSSVSGKNYNVIRRTNLVEDTSIILFTNVPGMPPMNTVTDTTAMADCPYFYWVELGD